MTKRKTTYVREFTGSYAAKFQKGVNAACIRALKKSVQFPSGYSKELIKRLVAKGKVAARMHFGKNTGMLEVITVYPRAICAAKSSDLCVAFSVPRTDAHKFRHANYNIVVHNATAGGVKVGDWCSLAHVVTGRGGMTFVVERC